MNDLLTPTEVAEMLRRSATAVREMCQDGELTWVPGGRGGKRVTYLIHRHSVEGWLKDNTVGGRR